MNRFRLFGPQAAAIGLTAHVGVPKRVSLRHQDHLYSLACTVDLTQGDFEEEHTLLLDNTRPVHCRDLFDRHVCHTARRTCGHEGAELRLVLMFKTQQHRKRQESYKSTAVQQSHVCANFEQIAPVSHELCLPLSSIQVESLQACKHAHMHTCTHVKGSHAVANFMWTGQSARTSTKVFGQMRKISRELSPLALCFDQLLRLVLRQLPCAQHASVDVSSLDPSSPSKGRLRV